jgi:hypothetical protein
MIGEIVQRRHSKRTWQFCLLVAGILAVGNFATQHRHLLLLSLAPAVSGIVMFAVQRRERLLLHFGEEGIEVLAPWNEFIRYDCLEAFSCDDIERRRHPHSFSFEMIHRGGVLRLPAKLDKSSKAVFRFLEQHLAEDGSIGPPSALRPYLMQSEDAFGKEHVRSYRALPNVKPVGGSAHFAISLALVLIGIVWFLVGEFVAGEYENWAPGGISLSGCSLIAAIAFGVPYFREPRHARPVDGGLIVTPAGYALQQQGMLGEMSWDEVTDIEYRYGSRRVRIVFDGGHLFLRDDYDRKLRSIYNRILDYWELPWRQRRD